MITADYASKETGEWFLSFFRKDGKTPAKNKLMRFYKTGDEVISVIFSTMKGRFYPSLTNAQVVRPSGTEFSV